MEEKIQGLLLKSGVTAKEYKFNNDVPKGPNPLKLSKWIAADIEEISEQIEKIEKDCDLTCICKSGCSACCQQLIVVLNIEVLALQPYLENLSSEELSILKEKVLKQCDFLEKNGILNESLNTHMARNKEKEIQDKYFQLHQDCIFLGQNKSCDIYIMRPTPCWTYRCYGDSAQCETSYAVPDTNKFNDWESRVLERFGMTKRAKKGVKYYHLQ